MMDNAQPMEISELRATIKQVVHGQPVPDKVMQQARGRFQTMCHEAAGNEFTEADVIRAVLSPSFERKRVCDCPTCKARRAEAEEGLIAAQPETNLMDWTKR